LCCKHLKAKEKCLNQIKFGSRLEEIFHKILVFKYLLVYAYTYLILITSMHDVTQFVTQSDHIYIKSETVCNKKCEIKLLAECR